MQICTLLSLIVVVLFGTGSVYASHSWGGYHWARTANPFTLKLGDNVTSAWDPFLSATSSQWSASDVLNTSVVPGLSNPKNCKATTGRVEVCNSKYGNNGWLGIAQIWVSGLHIVQATTKMNDTYFNTRSYNSPAWRQLVMCQEVGHTFGLNHQDEIFNNTNLGTCMDYTNDPDGTIYGQLSNEQPNTHDFDELDIIYSHLDTTTTISGSVNGNGHGKPAFVEAIADSQGDWGRSIRDNGRVALFEKDFGGGNKLFTFVVWAK